jgi:hypothetical protein
MEETTRIDHSRSKGTLASQVRKHLLSSIKRHPVDVCIALEPSKVVQLLQSLAGHCGSRSQLVGSTHTCMAFAAS